MESIPKPSQCTHVHNMVFLPQIYHLLRSSTQSHPGDGADISLGAVEPWMFTGLHVTVTALSRAPQGQGDPGAGHQTREKGA